jgi:hypothetical protein
MVHTSSRARFLSRVILLALVTLVGLSTQAAALGGICGGAIPCECGDRVVESRTLVPGVDPITTTICPLGGLFFFFDDNVTLDLGGSTLRGSCAGDDEFGIEINKSAGVTVRNGRIFGFDVGILGNGAIGATVSKVQVLESCKSGIDFNLIGGNRFEQCIVRRSGGDGIVVIGDDNTVHLCRSESNLGRGLVMHGSGNVATRNIVLYSGSDGVEIGGAEAVVELNQSNFSETGEGFLVSGMHHRFSRNIARDNAEDGFTVLARWSTFDQNRSDFNDGYGIRDSSVPPGTNTYTRNRCTGNRLGPSDPPGLCR